MKIFRNRIMFLFIPALILWVIAGFILLISPWYYGFYNDYKSGAYILIAIGIFLTVIEGYLKKRISRKKFIGIGLAFLFTIVMSLISIYFW